VPVLEIPPVPNWTADALERLPEEFRYEVTEGKLVIGPAAKTPWHSKTQMRLCNLLRARGRLAYREQGVVIGPGEICTCDVGVFRGPPSEDAAYHPAREFDLVIEVVSPDSQRADREVKPGRYAAGGIHEYWRVEKTDDGEVVVFQHRLVRVDGTPASYAETRVVLLSTLEKEGQ
jgi:Uma2 family endonuclease